MSLGYNLWIGLTTLVALTSIVVLVEFLMQ